MLKAPTLTCSEIERAFRLFHGSDRHAVGVDHRRLQAGVAQEILYHADVVICLEQVGGEGVAEGVGGNPLGNFCLAHGDIQRLLQLRLMDK